MRAKARGAERRLQCRCLRFRVMSQRMNEVIKGPLKYSNTHISMCVCWCVSGPALWEQTIIYHHMDSLLVLAGELVSKGTKRGTLKASPPPPHLSHSTPPSASLCPSLPPPFPKPWHTALSVVSNQKQLDHFRGCRANHSFLIKGVFKRTVHLV